MRHIKIHVLYRNDRKHDVDLLYYCILYYLNVFFKCLCEALAYEGLCVEGCAMNKRPELQIPRKQDFKKQSALKVPPCHRKGRNRPVSVCVCVCVSHVFL